MLLVAQSQNKVLLDEDARKFIVTSFSNWQSENPDVVDFSQVTGCQTEIREIRTELKVRDKDGQEMSFSPPRYDYDYDFYITIHVNSPWFNEMGFKINDRRVNQRGSVEYREMERQANEIKTALTQVRQELREMYGASTKVTNCPGAVLLLRQMQADVVSLWWSNARQLKTINN